MSGLFNPFKNNFKNNDQQNAGDFNVQSSQQPVMTQNSYNNNNLDEYQRNLINKKNQNENFIRPRKIEFENSYLNQLNQTPQFSRQNREIIQTNYINSNDPQFMNNQNRFMNQNQNIRQSANQQFMQNNYYPQNNAQNYNLRQEYLDFENQNYFDYGNYRDENQNNRMIYNFQQQSNSNFYNQHNNFYNEQPIYEEFSNYNNNMHFGYSDFSNNNQFYNSNDRYNYNPNVNYSLNSANQYNPYSQSSYRNRLQSSNIIPKPISKEIRSEKFRLFFMFIFGTVGIITSSLMLAVYYKTVGTENKIIGLDYTSVMYPFFSILLLIIAIAFFGVSLTDYTLLYSNVKKYERELLLGNESVPYFITRNYRSLISRAVYLNWFSFSFYIISAIILGCLYGLQAQHETGNTEIYILFWKIGELKSLESEITITIIILFTVLAIHVANIVTSRSRKNNIISYYGYEVIPQQEIKEIKKRANKICLIIFFVTLAIILFLIVIPWLIIRKKRGQSLKPWGTKS
ncbi:MSC_0882 family membrane protein [Spiroplasma taiwanense]|uniref:Transmembrane protein n=1 Tax=Spiroplasma taiwanense CT-1 TaxID=1276220 RepID=S5MGL1_9MOLU|nr:hypothetical protein [Spiroplasma taiwanense]AGR40990.1 hypothetical protein STAIW_v1c03320 [Spiroplasma taiwanense CT-1]